MAEHNEGPITQNSSIFDWIWFNTAFGSFGQQLLEFLETNTLPSNIDIPRSCVLPLNGIQQGLLKLGMDPLASSQQQGEALSVHLAVPSLLLFSIPDTLIGNDSLANIFHRRMHEFNKGNWGTLIKDAVDCHKSVVGEKSGRKKQPLKENTRDPGNKDNHTQTR